MTSNIAEKVDKLVANLLGEEGAMVATSPGAIKYGKGGSGDPVKNGSLPSLKGSNKRRHSLTKPGEGKNPTFQKPLPSGEGGGKSVASAPGEVSSK